jgi:hypothetical protein
MAEFNSEESVYPQEKIDYFLDDLRRVGPKKPIGYLSLTFLINTLKIDPLKIIEEVERKGLKFITLGLGETDVSGGALYVYDEKALKTLLDKKIYFRGKRLANRA